ncbi:enoyl-CoA hydratase/isomerase family protein [Oceanithermus sp.]
MEPVLYEKKGSVGTITLNRPGRLNAFDRHLLARLDERLKFVAKDGVRVLVMRGSGRAFSAGQDLQEAGSGELDYEAHLRSYNRVFERIRNLPLPVIAAVHGVAAGAGMSLALAADYRLLAESAVLITAFARIGLAPDTGITYTLPRLVGWGKAFELLALSPEISAAEALDLGLANKVVPDEDFDAAIEKTAAIFASGPSLVYGLIKQALDFSAGHSAPEVLAFEAALQKRAGASNDHREGLAAFAEKRQPRFRGN